MDRTEVHLDALHHIARGFAQESQSVSDMQSRLRRQADQLVHSGWVGRGSDKFFDAMYEELLPALNRLVEALGDASICTLKISEIYQRAQEDAASGFYTGAAGSGDRFDE